MSDSECEETSIKSSRTSRQAKKSPRRRQEAVGRRSRSRTKKTNRYLLVARKSSKSASRTSTFQVSNGCAEILAAGNTSHSHIKPEDSSRDYLVPVTVNINMIAMSLYLLSTGVRLYRLDFPASIVFDEQITGSQISQYMNRELYYSTSPPCSTQLYHFFAWLSGMFDADYDFSEVGKDYKDVPYSLLRLITVLISSLISPSVYVLLKELNCSTSASLLPALITVTDAALISQSRYFSNNSLFLSGSLLSLLFAIKYVREDDPASRQWLVLAGALSGVTMSMRYASVFTHLLVCFLVYRKFWKNISSPLISKEDLYKQFFSSVFYLLLLPMVIYLSVWVLHFTVLIQPARTSNASHTQRSMSSYMPVIVESGPKAVTNGSVISLHHLHGRDCWLHSHDYLYPKRYDDGRGSSHQQQVTCYPHTDANNYWTIIKLNDSSSDDVIRHGDAVMLLHRETSKLLNSHRVAAPMTSSKQEVSGYIDYNISMPADPSWTIEVENREDDESPWLQRLSHVKLIHTTTSSALSVTSKQLPAWAGGQYEVVADSFMFHENVLWMVDKIIPNRQVLPYNINTNSSKYSSHLWNIFQQILDCHKKTFLWRFKYEEDHQFLSSPLDWIACQSNLILWLDNSSNRQIHMLPNPIIWLTAVLALMLQIILCLAAKILEARESLTLSKNIEALYLHTVVCCGGFLLNYLPYFLSNEQLFLYHCLPSLVFLLMSMGCLLDALIKLIKSSLRFVFFVIFYLLYGAGLYFTYEITPLLFGLEEPSVNLTLRLQRGFSWSFL